jgi:hypothetical protein
MKSCAAVAAGAAVRRTEAGPTMQGEDRHAMTASHPSDQHGLDTIHVVEEGRLRHGDHFAAGTRVAERK